MFLRSTFRDSMPASEPLWTPDTGEEAPSGSKFVSPPRPVATGLLLHNLQADAYTAIGPRIASERYYIPGHEYQ